MKTMPSVCRFPSHAQRGEVSPSYGDGGVMVINADIHDPSVRFADTSPSYDDGEEGAA